MRRGCQSMDIDIMWSIDSVKILRSLETVFSKQLVFSWPRGSSSSSMNLSFQLSWPIQKDGIRGRRLSLKNLNLIKADYVFFSLSLSLHIALLMRKNIVMYLRICRVSLVKVVLLNYALLVTSNTPKGHLPRWDSNIDKFWCSFSAVMQQWEEKGQTDKPIFWQFLREHLILPKRFQKRFPSYDMCQMWLANQPK